LYPDIHVSIILHVKKFWNHIFGVMYTLQMNILYWINW